MEQNLRRVVAVSGFITFFFFLYNESYLNNEDYRREFFLDFVSCPLG